MTTIFLAGAEVDILSKALVQNGVKNILYSYFYILQMRKEGEIARRQAAHPEIRWFLDSGAFTYATMFRNAPERLPPYKEYIRRYFDYIEEYGAPYCRITEPDLDETLDDITLDMVDDWREEMLDRWPSYPIMPVWHYWRGEHDWTSYLADDRIQHLALGRGDNDDGMRRRLVLEAHQRGKTVHGFAMTRIQTSMKVIPFDSVDSTSWVMGQKYGTMYVFRNNKFTALPKKVLGISEEARGVGGKGTGSKRVRVKYGDARDKRLNGKENRRIYASYFRNIGCDAKKVLADDVAEVRKANIIAWRNLSERLERMRMVRGKALMDAAKGEPKIKDVGHPKERTNGVVTQLFRREPAMRQEATSAEARRRPLPR